MNIVRPASNNWEYETGDPSVGIFGDTVWHALGCLLDEPEPAREVAVRMEPADLVYDEIVVTTFECPCGERVEVEEKQPRDLGPDAD